MRALLFILFCGFVFSNPVRDLQPSYDPIALKDCESPLANHVGASLERLAVRLGVRTDILRKFYDSLAATKNEKIEKREIAIEQCMGSSDFFRESFIECLVLGGRKILNEALFHFVYNKRQELGRIIPTQVDSQKSVALLALLEDLIRENLENNGISTSWYIPGLGFKEGRSHADYAFEDGDIVLVLGNSSVSSIITQSTYPQRKFSHALMMRVENGIPRTMEALLEKGVVSDSEESFRSKNMNTLVVYRWKDLKTRKNLARIASDCAWDYVLKKTPYDFSMDMNDDHGMFCSKLVASCYAKASNLNISDIIPELAQVRADLVGKYLKNLGVRNKEMPSPGDIAASHLLVPVAEYRKVLNPNTQQIEITRLWNMLAMGDVFIERLEMGYEVRASLPTKFFFLPGVNFGNWILNKFFDYLNLDWSLIPHGLTAESLGLLFTQEKMIFDPSYALAEASLRREGWNTSSLLDLPPWVLRGHLSRGLQDSLRARWMFLKRD